MSLLYSTLDMLAYKDPDELCHDINMIAYNHNGCGLGFGFPNGKEYRVLLENVTMMAVAFD